MEDDIQLPTTSYKSTPQVAARRARLARIVKAVVGVCLGICVTAFAMDLFAGTHQNSSTSVAARARASIAGTHLEKAAATNLHRR